MNKKNKIKVEANKNDEIYHNYILKKTGMIIQGVLLFSLIVFSIITVMHPKFKPVCFVLMGLVLLVTAYNNHKIYKRKTLTIIYLVGAILSFLSCIEVFVGK